MKIAGWILLFLNLVGLFFMFKNTRPPIEKGKCVVAKQAGKYSKGEVECNR